MEAAIVVIRPYRADDAPHMAQLYYDAVHGLGRRFYSAAQAAAWAPAPLPPIGVRHLAADGRTTFVAGNANDQALA